jgi:hypothetical protein
MWTSLRTQREEFKVVKQGAETLNDFFEHEFPVSTQKNVPLEQTVVTISRLDWYGN